MGLTIGMEYAVEAALGTDVGPSVSKDRHDLAWGQGREFRLVAGEQDSLAFLFAEAMRHQAGTAFTAI
jgi:hypothetical protein